MYVGQKYYWYKRSMSNTIYTIVSIDHRGITVGWDDTSITNGKDTYTYSSIDQFKRLFVRIPGFKDYVKLCK